ncbi:hypothetical protein LT85_4787 [Collimonas arenae]|uniref:Uncharacterized protein n=1 Tax=Collimonas arenae TaxID=279058 RepID=A0A0A1FJN1_9BURK|nr:hypothetical protein LT85_4787 [Collimonas arenae]
MIARRGGLFLQQARQAGWAIALRGRCQAGPSQRRHPAAPAGLIRMLAGAAMEVLLTYGALRHSGYPVTGWLTAIKQPI